jgi:hypothetical protein
MIHLKPGAVRRAGMGMTLRGNGKAHGYIRRRPLVDECSALHEYHPRQTRRPFVSRNPPARLPASRFGEATPFGKGEIDYA